MKKYVSCLMLSLSFVLFSLEVLAVERFIAKETLKEKVAGFWNGQLVGNYMGFPFENVFVEEPVPFLVTRYYTYKDKDQVKMNSNDLRGFVNIFAGAMEGAFSDDDTDIEFVTLHGVEKHGLDITYPEIAEMWKTHINRKIWVANRYKRWNGWVFCEL